MTPDRFVGVDWGTSNLRLWLMDRDGRVLHHRRTDQGMIRCAGAKAFRAVLDDHLDALGCGRDVPVIACGMVGAREGWIEVPYLSTGTPLEHLPDRAVIAPHPGRRVLILPGVARRDRSAPDVMRGEETIVLGLLDGQPAVICQPGTHGKWIEVDGFAITRFSTHMTGELYEVLGRRSTLAPFVDTEAPVEPDAPEFVNALDMAIADPGCVLTRLFVLRAGGLLAMTSPQAAASALSGLLIGAEIGALRRSLALSRDRVVLVASGPVARLYGAAMTRCGIRFATEDAETALRCGLLRAAKRCDWSCA